MELQNRGENKNRTTEVSIKNSPCSHPLIPQNQYQNAHFN